MMFRCRFMSIAGEAFISIRFVDAADDGCFDLLSIWSFNIHVLAIEPHLQSALWNEIGRCIAPARERSVIADIDHVSHCYIQVVRDDGSVDRTKSRVLPLDNDLKCSTGIGY